MPEAVIVAETPIVEAPAVAPLGQIDSLTDYRARRANGEDGEVAEPKPVVEKPVEVVAEPEAASEAGKALAAKKGSLQARIDELTREKKDAEARGLAEAATLRAELAALKAGKPAEPKPEAQPVADPNDPEPDVNAFDSYEKFVKAQARWEARQEVKALQTEQAGRARVSSIESARDRVHAAAKAAHEDFDTTFEAFAAAGGVLSPVAQDVILNHELGHEIAYALAKDKGLADRINAAQNPAVAYLEIGRVIATLSGALEAAKVEVKAEPKAAPVSKAPDPVKPVTGDASAGGFDPSTSNSLSEFRKHRASL